MEIKKGFPNGPVADQKIKQLLRKLSSDATIGGVTIDHRWWRTANISPYFLTRVCIINASSGVRERMRIFKVSQVGTRGLNKITNIKCLKHRLRQQIKWLRRFLDAIEKTVVSTEKTLFAHRCSVHTFADTGKWTRSKTSVVSSGRYINIP